MKIAFFGKLEQEKKDFYQKNLTGQSVEFYDQELNTQNLPDEKDFEIISVFVGSKVDQKVLDYFPNLKLIAVRATGYDNVDLNSAKQRGIAVVNIPSYGSHTVAEFTFALILTLSRHISEAIARMKEDYRFDYSDLRGFDLFDKTIGIVGTGKIGANVARIAKGFSMNILAFDLYPNQKLAEEVGFKYTEFEDLIKQSDIITFHTPATSKTYHLLNMENIELVKQGAILINTSRGTVVDTDVLTEAVLKKQIKAAALDVLEDELKLKKEDPNQMRKHILLNLANVIITPHMAFYTKEAEDNIMQTTAENIEAFLKNNPKNLV